MKPCRTLTTVVAMTAKTETRPAKENTTTVAPAVRYLDKATFRTAKKRVFARHAPLLAKLAK